MKGKIYKVEDAGKVIYVGQTTQELSHRITQHKSSDSILGRKMRYKELQFSIVKEVSIVELDAWECFYIGHFNTIYPNGCNLQLPISSARMSDAIKAKIRKTKSKYKIYSIDKAGIIREFLSIRHASLALKINLAHIWEALNGKRYAAGEMAFWKAGQTAKTVEDIKVRKSTALIAVDENTGQSFTFASGYQCGKMLRIDSATVLRGLKAKTEIKYKNYRIRRIT